MGFQPTLATLCIAIVFTSVAILALGRSRARRFREQRLGDSAIRFAAYISTFPHITLASGLKVFGGGVFCFSVTAQLLEKSFVISSSIEPIVQPFRAADGGSITEVWFEKEQVGGKGSEQGRCLRCRGVGPPKHEVDLQQT